MLQAVRAAVQSGLPTIAECGGFLYLHQTLSDADGHPWPMTGVLPARAFHAGRLTRFGYVTLTARAGGLLCAPGDSLPAHEFHYWDSADPGSAFHAQKPQSPRAWDCACHTPSLYAGFPHLHLCGLPNTAKRFAAACAGQGRPGAAKIRD